MGTELAMCDAGWLLPARLGVGGFWGTFLVFGLA